MSECVVVVVLQTTRMIRTHRMTRVLPSVVAATSLPIQSPLAATTPRYLCLSVCLSAGAGLHVSLLSIHRRCLKIYPETRLSYDTSSDVTAN